MRGGRAFLMPIFGERRNAEWKSKYGQTVRGAHYSFPPSSRKTPSLPRSPPTLWQGKASPHDELTPRGKKKPPLVPKGRCQPQVDGGDGTQPFPQAQSIPPSLPLTREVACRQASRRERISPPTFSVNHQHRGTTKASPCAQGEVSTAG